MKVFIDHVRRLKPMTASAIWPRSGRSKFRQGRANFVRREARGDLGGLDSRDANRTTSPATAGDGDFDPDPDP